MTAPDPRLNEIQARTGRLLSTVAWAETPEERDEAENAVTADVRYLLAELRKAHEALAAVEEFASRLDAAASDYEPLYAKGKVSARASAAQLRAAVAAAKGDEA